MQLWALLVVGAGAVYSYQPLCVSNRCVNPIFPGMRVLGQDFFAQQEEKSWSCPADSNSNMLLSFCSSVVHYNFALPTSDTAETMQSIIKAEEHKALKAYFQHLSGIGMDAWDYQNPEEDVCSESIHKIICQAHFPQCNQIEETQYLRPCASSCQSYAHACAVECCDESVACVFDKEVEADDGSTIVESGFVAHMAPSILCTGDGPNSASSRFGLVGVLVAVMLGQGRGNGGVAMAILAGAAMQLQGCEAGPDEESIKKSIDGAVGHHTVGAWRLQPDFSVTDSFKKEDGTVLYDSCSDAMIDTLHVCSGRGHCEPWDPKDLNNPINFCVCENEWAGPECRVARKSQAIAFVYAVFGGLFGADKFYLGFPVDGIVKGLTFGGGGLWWLVDIVYTGVGPVPAYDYRTAADLPFWAFVLASIIVAMSTGFFLFLIRLRRHISEKRRLADAPVPVSAKEAMHTAISSKRPNGYFGKVHHLLESTGRFAHLDGTHDSHGLEKPETGNNA